MLASLACVDTVTRMKVVRHEKYRLVTPCAETSYVNIHVDTTRVIYYDTLFDFIDIKRK